LENQCHPGADSQYYNFEKTRFQSLFREGPNVVLDLGCGSGQLGKRLIELNRAAEVVGVEIFEAAAINASKYYNKVIAGDIENLELPYREYFDYIVCGDILEHLRDPWVTLQRVHGWLKPDGILIASIPNVRYWRVLRDLVFKGRWEYVDSGIMDITHLRFFTRKTFTDALEGKRFSISKCEFWVNGKKQGFFNKITFGFFQEFLGSQFMVLANKEK
jgi:SAM-dependent methyltransferase